MLKSPVGFARQANLRCLESPKATMQQSPGWKSTRQRALEPWVSGEMLRALQGRRRLSASPFRAWIISTLTQGSGRFASSTLGCADALSALRSLIPATTNTSVTVH